MTDKDIRLLEQTADGELDYKVAKRFVRHEDPEVRRLLARRNDVVPEILYYLADDPDLQVRKEVASNIATPRQADLLLSRDEDEDVRHILARKIAELAPDLSQDEQDIVSRITTQMLRELARDQMVRVRQVIAETLKDVTNAPADVIGRLARDTDLIVAGPVLRYSPVLTDNDLLEIINSNPVTGALSAISNRTQVAENVSDAIANSDDNEAIAVLLGNPSAQIREETLDSLIDRAPSFESWHEPIVKRPKLPKGAETRLARFLAHQLIDVLQEREDIDKDAAEEISRIVERRLDNNFGPIDQDVPAGKNRPEPEPKHKLKNSSPAKRSDFETLELLSEAYDRAMDMIAEGTLNENNLLEMAKSGDETFVIAAVSALAGISPRTGKRMFIENEPKAMVALIWRAGLSAKFAVTAQEMFGRMPAANILRPDNSVKPDKDDPGCGFPLDVDEMEWQLSLFSDEPGGGKSFVPRKTDKDILPDTEPEDAGTDMHSVSASIVYGSKS